MWRMAASLLVEVELEDGVHLRVCLARASTVSHPHSASPGRAWRVSSACFLSQTGHLVRARSGVGAARERLEKLLRVHCHGLLFAVACAITPLQYHGTLSERSFSGRSFVSRGAETAPQMLRMGKCVRNRKTEPCKRSGSSGTRRAGGRGGQGASNAHMSAKSGAADMARDRVAAIARVGRVLQAICLHPSTTRIDRRACTTARANRRQKRSPPRLHPAAQSRLVESEHAQEGADAESLLRGERMQGIGQIRPLARATRMRDCHVQGVKRRRKRGSKTMPNPFGSDWARVVSMSQSNSRTCPACPACCCWLRQWCKRRRASARGTRPRGGGADGWRDWAPSCTHSPRCAWLAIRRCGTRPEASR